MERQLSEVSSQRLAPNGLYLTDIGRLNEIYQAAKSAVIQPDTFTLSRLAKAIHRAEWVEK